MDDKKGKKNWIIYVIVICLLSATFIGVGVFMVLSSGDSSDIAYTWYDRSSGECVVTEGIYHGKADTLYLKDDAIDAYASARFHYTTLTEGSIKFYLRYDSDAFGGGDITMEFYSFTTMFSTLDHIQNSLMSEIWYLVELTFDCATNTGEVWIDGTFIASDSFTIRDSDGNDGFVIRTDDDGMINVYINMISITN